MRLRETPVLSRCDLQRPLDVTLSHAKSHTLHDTCARQSHTIHDKSTSHAGARVRVVTLLLLSLPDALRVTSSDLRARAMLQRRWHVISEGPRWGGGARIGAGDRSEAEIRVVKTRHRGRHCDGQGRVSVQGRSAV